jgi:NAD(P)H-flavin reductase/hemoglobin-like flavoprotein
LFTPGYALVFPDNLEEAPLDVARLRDSFDLVAKFGDEVPLYFYSRLFLNYPETRELFPVTMAAQRQHLVDALVKVIATADRPDELKTYAAALGVTHRRFGARPGQYEAVGVTLLATLEHFAGDAWTPDLAADWTAAYTLVSGVMTGAALEDEADNPPWCDGLVVAAEWRSFDVAVLHVTSSPAMRWRPGQSVPVEVPSRPRLWRWFSIATAPPSEALEFHVRVIDGGLVSLALATLKPGARIRMGLPGGELALRNLDRGLVMVAGSTGLAPLKAVLMEVAESRKPPEVNLYFGARSQEGLYDLTWLREAEEAHEFLTVTAVPGKGLMDAVMKDGKWRNRDIYVAGPAELVHESKARLTAAGVAPADIIAEDFGWGEPE